MSATSAITARNVLQTPCDMSGAVDLCALWEAAFEPADRPSVNDWRELESLQQAVPMLPMPAARMAAPETSHAERSASRLPLLREIPSRAAESVNVFVQAASVAIVVRDASLCADRALQCAFAAAGELAGERGALHQLTLNGRMIYQQRRDPDPLERTPGTWRLTV